MENTITYLYEDSSWGDLLTSYDGRTITYDTIGNPLNDGIWSYTWEQGRRLTKMQSSSATWNYAYDTTGLRTSRSNGTTNYRYWYNDSGLLLRMEKGSTVYSFTYNPAGRPVSISDGSNRYYYVLNQQGDVIGLLNSNEELIVMYVYDAWGRVLASADLTASGIGTNNPLRYRGYVYDTETGLYYLQSRYYNPTWGRFINADDPGYMGVDGTPVSYNLFAYCGNNPVMGFDPSGTFDWGSLFQGIGWLTTGVTALFVGLSVLTCGVATPLMVGAALLTTGAGALTAANGASEMGEAFTGYNVMRDGVFQGNAAAYNAYAYSTATVAQVGTAICGGWLKANQTQIADHKLQQIINDPNSISKYSTKQFEKIASQSSWQCGPTRNLKGFRAIKGDYAIRYSMNGTRFDTAHFYGKPYWVVSSALGKVKVPM